MDIIKGNKLIGEFMGLIHGPYIYPPVGGSGVPIKNSKFNSSWDWLMPSWGKLRSTVFEAYYGYPKEFMLYVENFKTACFNNSIGDAKNAVIDGIQWYNNQNLKSKDI